jgi:integral membrane protein
MIKIFKLVALLEGVSLLLLYFFAMPMKYILDQPIYVKNIGMAHGVLFIGYIILATMLKIEENWNWKKFAIICIASLWPFGTFYIDKKYLRNV